MISELPQSSKLLTSRSIHQLFHYFHTLEKCLICQSSIKADAEVLKLWENEDYSVKTANGIGFMIMEVHNEWINLKKSKNRQKLLKYKKETRSKQN